MISDRSRGILEHHGKENLTVATDAPELSELFSRWFVRLKCERCGNTIHLDKTDWEEASNG